VKSGLFSSSRRIPSGEEHWIPLSDLMTGLMMVFLLIAVAFMVKVQADEAKTRAVAVLYERLKNDLYVDLHKEFQADLPRWGAELHPDLTIRFMEPDILFPTGSAVLTTRFREILNNFAPRYLRILGYTSTSWRTNNVDEAYLGNMELSQERTTATLEFLLRMESLSQYKPFMRHNVTANGLSFSHLVYNKDGGEDTRRSQRVEFRVRTNADARLAQILKL
jgi:outer membrane protein OmpA-like peptidoglycan-associated protein